MYHALSYVGLRCVLLVPSLLVLGQHVRSIFESTHRLLLLMADLGRGVWQGVEPQRRAQFVFVAVCAPVRAVSFLLLQG